MRSPDTATSCTPGGRVVKNVAGFDLVRLYTGSWGTLGPITSLTVRLRALPAHDITLALAVPDPARLPALFTGLRSHALSLLACEWIDGGTARAIGAGIATDAVLVRIGGNDGFVRGQRATLETLGACQVVDPAVWGALAQCDASASAVVRVSGTVSGLPQRIARLRDALAPTGAHIALHATVGRGIVRVIVTGDPDGVRTALQSSVDGEQRIPERLPTTWWATEPDPYRGGLAGRIRLAFDPHLLCNRRVAIDA
ncbi:MAG: hypothetical protein U5K74_08785 [Gemmatimonadaceae bacterium]|nr:hypothetical protein [Gemmatimonadaceae bacterium]